METIPKNEESSATQPTERLAYSIQRLPPVLGVNYFACIA